MSGLTDALSAEPQDWRLRRLLRLAASGVALVWHATRRELVLATLLQLVSAALSVFIVILGVAMLLRGRASTGEAIEWRRTLLPLALCLGFAGGMVGRGVPFWLAAWSFVAVMIWTLQYRETKSRRRLALRSLAVGGAASVAIALVFQELFLIRLP